MQNNSSQNTNYNDNMESNNQLQSQKNGGNEECLVEKRDHLNGVGLLSLIHEVKTFLDTNYHKKIEELEFKLLEKDETIEELELEISKVKTQNEEKDLELSKLYEEIKESKVILNQFLEKLGSDTK